MIDSEEAPGGSTHSGAGQAAKRILDEIIAGDLKAGCRLYIKDLIARTDLGPTPLREGMSRLIASGLVKAIDHRGFQVTRIESSDLDDFMAFRLLLEEEALRQSIRYADQAWLDGISHARDAFRAFSSHEREKPRDAITRYSGLHKALHASMVAGCASRRLREHLDLLYDQETFYCHNVIAKDSRLADVQKLHNIDEHVALADAVMRRDAEAACRMLSDHVRELASMLRERLDPKKADK